MDNICDNSYYSNNMMKRFTKEVYVYFRSRFLISVAQLLLNCSIEISFQRLFLSLLEIPSRMISTAQNAIDILSFPSSHPHDTKLSIAFNLLHPCLSKMNNYCKAQLQIKHSILLIISTL